MAKDEMGYIYLIHFHKNHYHARHYLGFSKEPLRRYEHHCSGHGSRLLQVIKEMGIEIEIVWIRPGTRRGERKLKNQKNGPKLCPICNPTLKLRERMPIT